MLIKGVLLFLALGLVFFMGTLSVEYFLWLNSIGRMILFFCFLGFSLVLIYTYIFIPLLFLFKVRKGISDKDASLLIGRHFPEVQDRLYNLLELAEDKSQSELLLASIEQRSKDLNLIPFGNAIDFKENIRYVKYLFVPMALFLCIWATGNLSSFFNSYERVVHYGIAYEPPAPFRFELLTKNLDVLQGKAYTILATTIGDLRPDEVSIGINGNELLLREEQGSYKYTFSSPLEDVEFYFVSGDIRSRNYNLNVLDTPLIYDFELVLGYPKYLNKKSETLKSTGNATFPEGTEVTWNLVGKNTDNINLVDKDSTIGFTDLGEDKFQFTKQIFKDYKYGISTSNANVSDYEKLDYGFRVIKDEYPTITIRQVLDSLNPNISYYLGEASDDYKLNSIKLICYPSGNVDKKQIVNVSVPNANFGQIEYTFPSGLVLDVGIDYSFYFVATDNDALRNGKSSKSRVFSSALLNTDELLIREMKAKQAIIGNMDKAFEKFKEQQNELNEINKTQKEKEQLNFNEQKRIKDFLRKEQEQEELMQKFSQQLKEKLENTNENSDLNKLLQERLERRELEAIKNERLLRELNKISDKIDKEELAKKLEELEKKQQNSERSLEQLLELTKRYYVTEKIAQLAKDLDKMSERQNILSELKLGDDFSKKEQEKLNDRFNVLGEELEDLKKDNEDLKKPLDLKIDKSKVESVKQDQQDALEEINKHQGTEESSESGTKGGNVEKAKQKQKSAADKMKRMAEELAASKALAGGGASIAEDAEMLRQILDNLIVFSFKQESLFESLEEADLDVSNFSSTVKSQSELRALFEHVDDSLFALSLRRAELSEFVNEQITEVYYNIDKSLESMTENRMFQGVSFQKYVLKAGNNLADFLANILDNMQNSMKSGAGSGSSPDGFQLPDIIKGQGELKEKMDGMGQSGKGEPKDGQGDGKDGKEGKTNETGEKSGSEKGQEGKGDKGEGNGSKKGEGEGNGELSEGELRDIYEIYKQQQMLREQLEQQLLDMMNAGDRKLGEKLVKQIEDFENDLLENGVTTRTQSKMNTIVHELLKLENATLRQGEKQERESNSNTDTFQNTLRTKPSLLDNYRNEIEILNRQALPLRQNFQNKVKEYFKSND
jgi:hypothetical protein